MAEDAARLDVPPLAARTAGEPGASAASRLDALAYVAALGAAALVHELRPVVGVGLLLAYLWSRRTGRPTAARAAVLPVAAILAWGTLPQPVAAPNAAQCADLFAPPAIWRFIEAFVGLIAVAALVVDRRVSWHSLGLRLGSGRVVALAVIGLAVVTPLALFGGTLLGGNLLGGSFFGTYGLDLSQPAALGPALVFAVSNALAEELAYRGAMRTWLTPSLGIVGANLAQAVVFGLAHSGADFVGPVAPVAASMVLGGFIAGVIARRTGSLTLLIAIHAAADIPIYFFWACRIG